MESFDHRHDILGRHVILDVVYGGEDKTTSRSQIVNAPPYLVAHLLRRSVGKNPLGINAAAPESNILSEVLL